MWYSFVNVTFFWARFLKTHPTYCRKQEGFCYSARCLDVCTLPRNPMSHWQDEVCLSVFSWNTHLWLSCVSWKRAWIISVILISCCHGGKRHRHDCGQGGNRARPAALASTSRQSSVFLLGFAATGHHFICINSLRVFQPAHCCLETYQLLDQALASYLYFFLFFFLAEIS